MSLGNKPDRATLRPFPVDRIVVPHYDLDATTYDARIPVQNILLHAGRKELVVRPACDACVAKKVHCNRDGRQCEGCEAEGVECDWASKQWEKLPGPQNGSKQEVKQKRPYTRKAKVALADGDEPAKKLGRKPAAASTSTTSKRKRAADDEAPAKATAPKRSKKQEGEAYVAQLDNELAAIRAAAKIATPEWKKAEAPPVWKRVLRPRTGRRPPLWVESLQDLVAILPRYNDNDDARSKDGIVKDWDSLLLGVGGTAHRKDKWVQDGVLQLSFEREFTKLPEPNAPRPAAPNEQAVAGQLVPVPHAVPPVVQHPPSAEPVPSNVLHPPRLPAPPPATECPALSPPDDIAMLLRLYENQIPLLVLASAAWPLCPPCKIPDTGVLWLGFFGIERVDEDFPVTPVLGAHRWVGTKRWTVRLRWCFHESLDGERAPKPWFHVGPRTQAADVPAEPGPSSFSGYPQLAGRAPPDEGEMQIDRTLRDAVVAEGVGQLSLDAPPPHRPPGSFIPANYPLEPLPSAVYVNERREGDPPKGWCCPCGRLNIRRWLSEWDCAACTRTRPIPALHSRAVRPKWDIRSPIIDLEVASHARGTVPPLLEGWDDGSSLMRYPSAGACHVVPARDREDLDRVFEELQTAPRAFGRGFKVGNALYFGGAPGREEREGVKVVHTAALGRGKKIRYPPFGMGRAQRLSAQVDIPALLEVREWMDLALALVADTSEPHSDAELSAAIPTTAGKTLFGLMWLEEVKAPFQLRLPVVDPTFDLVALALGANVTLSLPARPRQAPKPREKMHVPNEFLVSLAHGDVFVLEELAGGEMIEIRSDGAAMLLVCY